MYTVLFLDEKALKSMVENNAHLHVAMFGRSEIETFQSTYKYVSIISSPGIAFIVRDPLAELDKTAAIMNSLAGCWPAIIIIFVFSWLAGIFIWITVGFSNLISKYLRQINYPHTY